MSENKSSQIYGEPIAALLADLGAGDARRREQSANELFRRGCAAAEPVLQQWFADSDFRSLLPGRGGLLTVGLAVKPERFAALHRALGAPGLADVPAEQQAREFDLEFAHHVRLDILTTPENDQTGAIARFLARFGEGVQQVEIEVRDVTRATARLRERFSIEPVYPEARPGANGTRINFFLMPLDDVDDDGGEVGGEVGSENGSGKNDGVGKKSGGEKILIELVELSAGKKPK